MTERKPILQFPVKVICDRCGEWFESVGIRFDDGSVSGPFPSELMKPLCGPSCKPKSEISPGLDKAITDELVNPPPSIMKE